MSLFNDAFVEKVVHEFGVLGGREQMAGMKAIVTGFEAYGGNHDLRWLAYMLATAFHETASKMEPVREAFWLSEDWRRSHLSYYPYYGRGYVQLTHTANYKKAGDDIGVDLVTNPRSGVASRVCGPHHVQGDDRGLVSQGRAWAAHASAVLLVWRRRSGRRTQHHQRERVQGRRRKEDHRRGHDRALPRRLPEALASGSARIQALVAEPVGPASDRFGTERAILIKLADSLGLVEPVKHMLDLREARYPASHPRYWAVIDFRQRSEHPRFHVLDIEKETTDSYLCAHGKGSDPDNDGKATHFSNEDGSNMSSLGVYRCAETYYGVHGLSMRLDGLENTNSHARHRAIVVHAADYVSDAGRGGNGRVGRSLGCPAVDERHRDSIIGRLRDGSFAVAWNG